MIEYTVDINIDNKLNILSILSDDKMQQFYLKESISLIESIGFVLASNKTNRGGSSYYKDNKIIVVYKNWIEYRTFLDNGKRENTLIFKSNYKKNLYDVYSYIRFVEQLKKYYIHYFRKEKISNILGNMI
jgi:hypothetical protein